MTTALSADDGAHLSWLPQELIVYDGGALRRRLRIALAPTATLLMVEPVVFGRAAMGERVRSGAVSDRIAITRAGRPLYVDGLHLTGDIDAALRGRAAANGAGAMASVVYAAPDAQAHLAAVRALLPLTGGASVLQDGLLVIRLVARDAFDLRRHLVPILDRLSRDTLPAAWRL